MRRAGAGIAANGDDEYVSERAGLLEEADMTRVEEVERAPGAHYDTAVALRRATTENQLSLRNNLSQTYVPRRAVMRAAEETILPCAVVRASEPEKGARTLMRVWRYHATAKRAQVLLMADAARHGGRL
jgi:hypothetical protein